MTWHQLYFSLPGPSKYQALLMIEAWKAIANLGDEVAISNFLINTLHPTGVMAYLDSMGTRPSEDTVGYFMALVGAPRRFG